MEKEGIGAEVVGEVCRIRILSLQISGGDRGVPVLLAHGSAPETWRQFAATSSPRGL